MRYGSNLSCEEMIPGVRSCRSSSKVNAPAKGLLNNVGSGDCAHHCETAIIV
jgi:hypothetical protein